MVEYANGFSGMAHYIFEKLKEMILDLLPINTRVTHFNGDASTHGKGTIVGYNGIEPNAYLNEKPTEAIQLAGEAGLMNALVGSFYDKNRCPYVVHWDPSERYPEGYKDVYEPTSIREIKEEVTT